jgi:hypothetical protein
MTNKDMQAEIDRLRAALREVVEAGTRTSTVRVGDMYDEQGGYEDYETVSEEAEIAARALAV